MTKSKLFAMHKFNFGKYPEMGLTLLRNEKKKLEIEKDKVNEELIHELSKLAIIIGTYLCVLAYIIYLTLGLLARGW